VETVISKLTKDVIRLTNERWSHIIEEHPEMIDRLDKVLNTIAEPESIYQGYQGELLATKLIENGKCLVVVYKEAPECFIITAFSTKRVQSLQKRKYIYDNS
jgi:hypothetical protein